ncbi:O-methyltransferase [Desarmillaria ectypa]|nr:O-methyltransferase [Desarmillaria ectypa]
MSPPSPLKQLVNLIASSVDHIESHFKANGTLQYPSLGTPFDPTSPAEALSTDPAVIPTAIIIVSACAQLSATVNVPALTMYDAISGFHFSSALHVALEANVVEILRGNPQGLHARARVIRLLATHHIFNETAPDTFSNNRISSMMDTLKSVEDIQTSPENKHVGSTGVAALLEHSADEVFKSSAYLTEVLLDKKLGYSDDHKDCPFSYAYKTEKHMFEWYDDPGNEFRLKRFASAMEGAAKLDPPNAILSGFQWGSLPSGSVVVDVGGGFPSLKIVVQDRPKAIDQAKQFWSTNVADAVPGGAVTLQAHDFFTPQPIKSPAIFMCQMVFHDYGKSVATKILKQLRSAASSDTKLLVIDQMYTSQGGEERILGSFIDILGGEGWKIEEVFTIPGTIHKRIPAVPV